MKTFKQFNEDARGAGASFRDGVNKGFLAQMDAVSSLRRGTTDFIKGLVTNKAGSKPGHPQHVGQQTRGAIDRANAFAKEKRGQAARATIDFVRGLVTGK